MELNIINIYMQKLKNKLFLYILYFIYYYKLNKSLLIKFYNF